MTVKDAENIKLAGCLLPMRRHGKGVLPDVTAATRDRRGNHPRDACAGWAAEGSGTGDPTARKVEKILQRQRENDKKIRAVEQAWMRCDSDDEREFIKQNLFRHKQMQFINLPFSIITMKRYRKRFLIYLAEELREI